jgi:hypothetical protein
MAAATTPQYPVRLHVEHPYRLSRLTTFFRLFLLIPAAIIQFLVTFGQFFVLTAVVLMLLFTKRYPHAWFEWIRYLTQYSMRISLYSSLMTDQYPSTTEGQGILLQIDEPEPGSLSRWMPLVKWFIAIPHYIVLYVVGIIASIVIVIAWFAILFVGRFPEGMFDFVLGYYRWTTRVSGYAFLLVTDRYPPFRLR